MPSWTPTTFQDQPARLYEDGAIRNDKGHFLARHPNATEGLRRRLRAIAKRNGSDESAVMKLNGGQAMHILKAHGQIERKVQAQRAAEFAMMQAAASSSPGNPKVPTEAWGLLAGNLTERALMDENTGHAVSAIGMIGRMTGYLSDETGKAPQQAIQVNVTIEAGALDQAEILEARWSERYEPLQLEVPDPDPPDVQED